MNVVVRFECSSEVLRFSSSTGFEIENNFGFDVQCFEKDILVSKSKPILFLIFNVATQIDFIKVTSRRVNLLINIPPHCLEFEI